MNKLIKGTLTVLAAGAAAAAVGFVAGVGTNLVLQVRAIKKDIAETKATAPTTTKEETQNA